MLPGPEPSLSLLGPYLRRLIYGGAALGRGFEELSGGERGQRRQINAGPARRVVSP